MPRFLAELNIKAVWNEAVLDLPHENNGESFSASLYCFNTDDVSLIVR